MAIKPEHSKVHHCWPPLTRILHWTRPRGGSSLSLGCSARSPTYLLKTCHLTDRSDVYSFGVLLVELASARRPIETKRDIKERLTARWAMARFIGGTAADVLDPHLARTPAAERALEMLLELSFRCMGPVR